MSDEIRFTQADVDLLLAASECCLFDDHYLAAALGAGEWTKGRDVRLSERYLDAAKRLSALVAGYP